MPNRRNDSDRYNRNSTGVGGYGSRDHSRSEGGRRGLSQWSRNSRDLDQNQDDHEGRSPRHDDYQFDRDPSSFDRNMSGRGSNARQGRGASGMGAYSDMGYNYQASTAQNQNQSSYWNPAQQDTSWGSEGRGINSYQSGYGSANSPESYQGHGINIGPNDRSDRSSLHGSHQGRHQNWEPSSHGSGSGYGNHVGNAQTGYGSYQGTAGSQYGSYEGNRPSGNSGTHSFSDPGSTFYNNNFTSQRGDRGNQGQQSWGSTQDWANQSGRQSMGSGYGSYQGSSHGSYQGANAQGSREHQQHVNPGFQNSSSDATSQFSRNENFGRYEGASATDHYNDVSTGFSGPFRGNSQSQGSSTFSGRGPKGYRRSDERIKDDVCYALMMAPEVDASHIEVEVKEGAVTLGGTVEDRKMKRMAEDCIENVQGVMDVHNQLKVTKSLLGAIGAALTGQKDEKPAENNSSVSATQSETSNRSMASSGTSDSDFTQDSKSRQSKPKS